MTDVRLIACDLDGTLLPNGIKMPTQRALRLITQLEERGILFFAASGRQLASLKRLFGPVADRIGYLCENGALVVRNDETLSCRTFPRAQALAICRAVLAYPGADLLISCPSATYVKADRTAFADELRTVVKNDVATFTSLDELREPIIKIAFQLDHEALPCAIEHFTALFGDEFDVVTSGHTWIDFLLKGVNKGTALEAVSARLAIPTSRIAAFGDNENDRAMLTVAGHPYLMETCNPNMRDLSPRVSFTTSVEDEIARMLA